MGKGIFKSLEYIGEIFLNTIFPKEYKCLSCNKETEDGLCYKCKNNIKLVREINNKEGFNIYSYGYYKGAIKSLILDFKYHNDYNCGEYMAELLIDRFSEIIKSNDAITYVPLTYRKKKIRGFNQCEFLSKYIGKNSDVRVEEILYKIKDNKEQKTLDVKARLKNQQGLFKLSEKYNIEGKTILLIDDVITTGATIAECGKVLISNGAKQVNVLTFAKSTI